MKLMKEDQSGKRTSKYKGKLYGFPVSMDTEFLYYRKDLITIAPETWNEYLARRKHNASQGRVLVQPWLAFFLGHKR
jgi:maltose-binding protein MalE